MNCLNWSFWLYLVWIWQLIWSSSNLILREANGEDDCSQAEEDDGHEADPLGVLRHRPPPDGDDDEDEGRGDAEAAEDDAHEAEEPDPGQRRRIAGGGSPV